MSIGVPIRVLHEAEGHIITCETTTGEVYRGMLVEADDNMNCQMIHCQVSLRDGSKHQMESIFIRGSKIRFLILPDMLKNAPMFQRVQKGAGSAGRGKSAILRAQVARGRGRGDPQRGGRGCPQRGGQGGPQRGGQGGPQRGGQGGPQRGGQGGPQRGGRGSGQWGGRGGRGGGGPSHQQM